MNMKKKFLGLILSIIIFIIFNVQVYASMPSTLSFETIAEMRELVLVMRGSSDEIAEYIEKDNGKVIRGYIPFKHIKLMVEDRIMYAPFVDVVDGVDYDSFNSEVRYSNQIDYWLIKYKIDGVLYLFQYVFDEEVITNQSVDISKDCNLSDCNITLTQNEGKYWGTYKLSEGVTLHIDVICEDMSNVDLGLFNLRELSLENDADENIDNILIISGAVLLTAIISSSIAVLLLSKRRRSKN